MQIISTYLMIHFLAILKLETHYNNLFNPSAKHQHKVTLEIY